MKNFVAIVLTAFMLVSLAACEQTESSSPSSTLESADSVQSETKTVSGVDNSEPVELTMVIQTDGIECADNAMLDEAINELLNEKLNVTLNIKRCTFTDTRTNMNLWLSSGEPCDVFNSWFSWSTYKDYYADLTPYQDLMPNALEALGNFISNGYNGDQLLGLPAIKDWVSYSCYMMRKDIVEETGMNPEEIKTFADFEALLRKIKENHPDMYPLTNGTAGRSTLFTSTVNAREDGTQYMTDMCIGTGLGIGLMDPATSSEVSCMFFSDFYKDTIEMAYRWTEEGLMYDSSILNGFEQVVAGTAAGYATSYKPGIESQETVSCGTEMVAVCMPDPKDGVLVTNTNFNWGVNKNCKDPERACQLLDLLYYDVDLNNLLSWGIEGVHYVKTDDPNIIEYPEGIDASTVSYYSWGKWELPNNYLQYVMAPSPSNLWEEMDEFNMAAAPSKALGFVFDTTPVEGEITAVQNVITQYDPGLGSGTLEPSKLEEFQQALLDNGVQKIIDEAQRQLDEFISNKQ